MIAAGYERDGRFYKSDEVRVEVGQGGLVQDIVVRYVKDFPESVVKTTDPTQVTVVSVPSGPTVVAPANSISTSGSVNISVTPDTRAPSQGETKVVGTAYDIEARDQSGQNVSKFNSAITLTIPYDDSELVSLGIMEDNLALSFWDETSGTWKILENYAVNKEDNLVTATIDHLTRFAIVAAADITPPLPPSEIKISAPAEGGIELSWANPVKDFSHVKIYRSTESGKLGDILAAEARGSAYSDRAVEAGITYFYTLRSVDTAGNESANKDQVSAATAISGIQGQPSAPIEESEVSDQLPLTYNTFVFARDLKLGMSGRDVYMLQVILNSRGVLIASSGPGSPGAETEYFGELTKQAVVRFQEMYASEILIPAGLNAGTGFVGPSTRAKLSAIDVATSVGAIAPPMAKADLWRNLSEGSSGQDVRALQMILNANGAVITESGPGSPGAETEFFGALTKNAVIRFQEKYADDILAPLGLTSGTGFVGPSTLKILNSLSSP